MGLFGQSKPVDPLVQMREWKGTLKKEERKIEREIQNIKREQLKTKAEIKRVLKAKDNASARILAKEVVHSNKAIDRLYTQKAHLNSAVMTMQSQMATVRMAGCLQKSAQVMGFMNQLIKLPQLNAIMMNMSREMEKAGIIDEMLEEVISMDDEDIEEAADEEVDAILVKLTQEALSAAPAARKQTLKVDAPAEEEEESDEEDRKVADAYSMRLSALHS